MRLVGSSKPFWRRQLRNPVGVLAVLAMPVLVIAAWVSAGAAADRWLGLMLWGWSVVGLVPAALNARRDDTVELRWRSLPVGAAERWLGAFLAFFPLPLVASVLLAAFAPGQHPPLLLAIAALEAAVMVAGGMAIGAWSRSAWECAGLLGLALVASAWTLLPNAGGWAAHALPTGQARLALLTPHQVPAEPLLALAMMAAVLALVGMAGVARR